MNNFNDRPFWAQQIATLRKNAGLTQKQLAEAIEKPFGTVRQLEAGLFKPSFSTILKIAKVLHADPYEIMNTDFKTDGTTSGFSEFVDKDFSKLSKILSDSYDFSEASVNNPDAVYVLRHCDPEVTPAAVITKTDLIRRAAEIKLKLDKKYEQELKENLHALVEDMISSYRK